MLFTKIIMLLSFLLLKFIYSNKSILILMMLDN